MSIREDALAFFDACETGKGWDVCRQWCAEDASFRAQSDALEGVTTLEDYTNWMHGITQTMPDAGYEIMSFGVDEERGSVCAAATVKGTHTVEGGPVDFQLPFHWTPIECPKVPDEFGRFINSIQAGQNTQPDFARGAEIQKLIDACFESSETGTWVDTSA